MKCTHRTEYVYEEADDLKQLSKRMTALDKSGWELADPKENETDDETLKPRTWHIAGERQVCTCVCSSCGARNGGAK